MKSESNDLAGRMTEEQKDRLLAYVKESLEQERTRRDQIAAARGWSVHPNDMDIEDEEREAVLKAWRTNSPKPEH